MKTKLFLKNVLIVYLFFTALFTNLELQAQVVCGPINTLYQTIGRAAVGIIPGATEIYRYNNFQQTYLKVSELKQDPLNPTPAVDNSSAPNSAYNATTQFLYSNFPTDGANVIRVYDPSQDYKFVGKITITGASAGFNNTLFAQGNFVGYVNGVNVVRFNVTGIASYPATVAVTQFTIAPVGAAPNDFSLIGDNIYGVSNISAAQITAAGNPPGVSAGINLRIINLTTQAVSYRLLSFDNTLDPTAQGTAFGATWQDRVGNFYFFSNSSGDIYRIPDVITSTNTIATKVLLANPSGQNDGFGCELGQDPFDWDADGVSDIDDIDDDNDGILDVNESPFYLGINPGGDNDGDRIPNYRDTNDSAFISVAKPFKDVNGDGVNDNFDFDLDSVPDSFDLDSDNDGIPDNVEGQITIGYISPSGLDDDRDGLDNAYEFGASLGLTPVNTDGVGYADNMDLDSDNDGFYDTAEAGITLTNNDIDGDGLDNATDTTFDVTDPNGNINIPSTLPDSDGDVNTGGNVNYRDVNDNDNDGINDIVDLDDDNDGILDTVEYPITLAPFGDEDGDGIFNFADAFDNNVLSDGSLTNYTDSNNDGIPDAYDFDLDGIPNHLDINSDGDGCNDANEAYGSSTADTNGDGTFGGIVGAAQVNPNGTVILAGYSAPVNLDNASGNTILDFLQRSVALVGITTQPVAISTIPGNTITFSVVANTTGSGTAETYTWQVQISGSGPWNTIVNGGVYSNATTANLSILANSTLHTNKYRVIITTPSYICDSDYTSDEVVLCIIPDVPTIVSTAASCSSAGTSTISNYSASNTYVFNPATAGITINASGLISGLTVGTSYTVTSGNGTCTSAASGSFSNAAQLVTPAVPTITSVAASCSSAGTSTINNYSASNTYVFNPATAGITVNASGLINGLTVGTSYTVTSGNGICTSVASGSFSNAAQLVTPAVPSITPTQLTCGTATGTITVNTPVSGPGITYTLTGTSPIVASVTSNTGIFDTLAPGAYDVTTSLTTGSVICESPATSVSINNFICANDDGTALVPFATVTSGSTVVTSVIANDTLNGVIVTIANTDVTAISGSPLSIDVDGFITVASGTPSGDYSIVYTLSTSSGTIISDTATAFVRVSNPIDAVVDTFPTQTPSTTVATTVGSVLSNNGSGADTLNGVAATTANTDVTPITTGPLSIDANGVLTLAPNTTSGTYTITYQLCESGTTVACSNFDTATATVVVLNPIDAVVDVFPTQTPSTTVPTTVGNVTANDTLNGVLVTPTNTDVTPVTSGPLSIDGNGVLTLSPNTPSGSYPITYTICEVNPTTGLPVSPTNCDTVTNTIVVLNPIDAVVDVYPTQTPSTTVPTTVGNVTANDTLNGVLVTPTNTDVTPVTSGPLSIDGNGVLTLAPNTPSGSYPITYTICEVNPTTGLPVSPTNCDTVTNTIVVLNPIDAVVDVYPTQTPSTTVPTTVGNVTANDTLNGVLVTPTNTDVTPVTSGPLSIDGNGVLTLAPNTPSGSYPITYTICEVNPTTGLPVSPTNCDTVTNTIVVLNPIDAVEDVYPTQTPSTTVPTTVGNVTANDTLNGVLVTPTNTDVTPVTSGPLSIDGNGVLTLSPNTPSGSYPITYTICEVNPTTGLPVSPTNCDTVTNTIVVLNPIDAVVDVYPTQTPSTTVPTTVGNVTANDTLNGVLVTPTNTDVTPVTSGPLSIDGNGVLTLAPNTPSGSYPITYTICEVNPTTGLPVSPTNCDTVTNTIVVLNPIDAVVDVYPTQTPSTTVPTTVGNVTANDTLNGVLVTPTNTDVTPVTSGPLSIDGNGVLTLAPNTPSGSYPITYTICEVNPTTGLPVSPTNCDTVTNTIVVLNPIDAVVDVYPTQTPSTTVPTTVGNVTANDTLNGVLVTPTNTDVTPVTSGPLSIDGNGVLTLAPNTPSGSYPITYTICEVNPTTGLPVSPTNCDTVTNTIVVLNPIDAVVDVFPTQTPSTTVPTTVGNVTANDTLNGVLVTPTNTDVTPVTSGPLSIDGNGVLTLAPNTPSGSYPITYTICEVNPTTGLPVSPTNCDTVTNTIVVLNPIDAVVDVFPTQTPSTTVPTTVGNVTANDTLNGVLVTPTNTDVTPVTSGPLSIDGNGVLTLSPNTPSGSYPITYTICEVNPTTGLPVSPTNCDTVTNTIVVLNPIDAVVDVYPTQTPSTTVPTTVGNVTANDTLNGVLVTPTNTDVTPVTSGPLSIDGNGVLTLAPNTPSGSYPITYTICEVNPTTGLPVSPTNCDTVTNTIVVLNPIDAVVDVYPTQTPSTTVPTTVGNVTANDTLNGVLVTPTNTDVTPVTSGPLSIDGNGVLTLAPNTPSGSYPITYTICEVNPTTGLPVSPTNCDTVTNTIVVLNPIDAVVDVFPTQTPSTTVPTTVGNVTANDTLNGVLVTPTNTDVTPITTGPLSIDANGVLTLAPNTTSGTYTITYQLCEVGAVPTNCDNATATVVVLSPIDAVVDTFPTQTPSTTVATTVGSVLSNNGSGADTLNGVAATTTNTDVTPITTGPLSIDANGVLTLAPNTTSGTYTITYQLCEVGAVPTNCDNATATVVVLNPIDAKDDTNPIAINGFTGGIAIPTVLSNDTLNSILVGQSQVSITLTSPLPAGITFNLVTGAVGVNPQTPAGIYTFTYNLCEFGAVPVNCDPATVTVRVSAPVIDAKPDTIAGGNGANGNSNAGNVLNNNGNGTDTLNGVAVTIAQVNLTVTTPAASINGGPVPTINTATGQISIPSGTPAGSYSIVYQICEKLNPTNCSSSTITITILASVIDAVNDDYSATPIPSFPGGTTASVIVNDRLNNLPAIIGTSSGQVRLTAVTVPAGLTLNADGTIRVASNTAAGTYQVVYTICEVLNPSNCDTATATVVVTAQRPSIAVIKTATAVDENGDGNATVGETIRYNFTITNTGNVPLTNITITDLLPGIVITGNPITLGPGEQDTNSFYGIYKITQTDASNEVVINQATVSGTSPLGVIVKDLSDSSSNTSDGQTVLSVQNCVIVVSNALTPNGDGMNDYFHIEGLDCFSNNTVEIYNRWGVLVFETSKYNNVDNVFEGFSRGRTTISQPEGIPAGTYYYVIKYVDFSGNGVQKVGYLYLNR